MKNAEIIIPGQLGKCGDREVFMAFEQASVLCKISFADILDEDTGAGYQRRFNREHSLSFKKYIHTQGSTTIPLTFNLRPEFSDSWEIKRIEDQPTLALLHISNANKAIMAQVDCQHRLGFMNNSSVQFAFMAYLGLNVTEEMEIFRDINGKAKGLSSSLLQLTEAKLIGDDLHDVKPELYYAMQLANFPSSPWYKKLDMGGKSTVGNTRVASLSTMQQAVRRFLKIAQIPEKTNPSQVTNLLIAFWLAVSYVLKEPWSNPRRHLLNKSIGVYSLMSLAGDLVNEAYKDHLPITQDYFIGKLSDFIDQVDWSSDGSLKGYGGVKGADAALEMLRQTRELSIQRLRHYGKQEYSVN